MPFCVCALKLKTGCEPIHMAQVPQERITIRAAMAACCAEYPAWRDMHPSAAETYIRHLERSCCTHTIVSCERDGIDRLFTDKRFLDRYSASTSRVLAALKASPALVEGIIGGRIACADVASLPTPTLCPSAGRAERDMIERRRASKFVPKTSSMYKCRKCGGRETIPIDYQSLAADEMGSTSVKCIKCQNVQRV